MIEFGFEKEYFIKSKGQYCIVPDNAMGHDDCGYLAEARGTHHENPITASFLFDAAEYELETQAAIKKVKLIEEPFITLPKDLERQALRQFGKSTISYDRGNIYGLDYDVNEEPVARAGLHVHFSNKKSFVGKDSNLTLYGILNIPKLIQLLDKAFEKEIKEARRLPGFYEMKSYGFEYRSLPNTVSTLDVAEILKNRSGIKEW